MSIWEFVFGYWDGFVILPAYAFAIVIAIVRWKHHPTTSGLAIGSFLLLACGNLGHLSMQFWIVNSDTQSTSSETRAFIIWIVRIVLQVPRLAAYVLLILAIFSGRVPAGESVASR